MAGCKRCALKSRKGKGKKKRKERKRQEKIVLMLWFFISPRACFFHMRSGHCLDI